MTSTAIDLSAIRTDQTSYKGTFRALIGVYSTAEVDALIAGVGSGSVVWGDIGGTLANQTDLQNALNAKQPSDATLTALAGVTTAADQVIYATGVDTFSVTDLSAFGRSLIDDASASAARTTLGLGDIATLSASAKQDSDATLTALAGLAITADKLPYGNGSDTFATTDLTAFGRSLIDDVDASTARTTLGLGTIATLATSAKQDALVSGTNIKTINGTTILGSGDLVVSGGIGGSTGSTDNAILRADGTGGGTAQSSSASIDDSGSITCKNGTFKHTTSANPGGIVIRDYQTSNGGFSNLEIAGPAWGAGTGLQFINHIGSIVCGTSFQCSSSFGAVTLYAGVSGNPGAVENGVRITADTTNAYIFTIKYASSPYPPLIVSGTGIKLNTGNGAWSNQAGWGTTALELKTDQTAVFSGLVSVGVYTVSTLPSASANAGKEAQVTDSSVTSYRATVAGGGSSRVKVFSDGTNWIVGG